MTAWATRCAGIAVLLASLFPGGFVPWPFVAAVGGALVVDAFFQLGRSLR